MYCRCQLRCDELKKLIDDLRIWYGAMGRDRDDICNYLTDSSNAVEKKVVELSKVLEHQQQADKKETDELKLHLNQQKEELQKEVDRLKSKSTLQSEIDAESDHLLFFIILCSVKSAGLNMGQKLASPSQRRTTTCHMPNLESAVNLRCVSLGWGEGGLAGPTQLQDEHTRPSQSGV